MKESKKKKKKKKKKKIGKHHVREMPLTKKKKTPKKQTNKNQKIEHPPKTKKPRKTKQKQPLPKQTYKQSYKHWNMKVTVILIIISALGIIPEVMEYRVEELEIRRRIETTALLRSARILRGV